MGLAEDAAVAGKALNNSISKRTKNKQLPPQFEASPCRARASRGKPKMLACFGRPEQDEGSGEWEGGTPNSVEFGVPPSHSDESPITRPAPCFSARRRMSFVEHQASQRISATRVEAG